MEQVSSRNTKDWTLQKKLILKGNFQGIYAQDLRQAIWFLKTKHDAKFANNCEDISKIVVVNYKRGWPKANMLIINMDKLNINMSEAPEDTTSRIDVFIW